MPPGGDDSQDLDHFPFLARLEILPEWEAAARLFLERGGAAMVLGAPDTGKSTLSRYLLYKTFAAGLPGALVDLDLGQSHLGPPTALGLGLFPPRLPGDNSLFPESLYFIGQTSPVGSILEVAVGCRVLMEQAARQGVSRVVVNTSGLVHGPGALRLKKAQVELLQPRFILALQRHRELEPLLQALGGEADPGEPGWTVRSLPVSSRVTRKTPEDRRRYREERFRRYFQEARRLVLPWRSLVWEGLPWGKGEPLASGELQRLGKMAGVPVLYGEATGARRVLLVAEPPPGNWPLAPGESLHWLTWSGMHLRLVGLLDGARRTLALGLILPSPWNPEEMAFWTPLSPDAASRVHFLQVGKMRVSLTGKEMAYV
ncbi:MAG: Clp1/GlmU family protein [Thermodesulfobacteriota bacterium]